MTKNITNSSLISSVTTEGQKLTLAFRNGKTTSYVGVPEWKSNGLMNSTSPGSYYNREIRSQYKHG